MPRLPKAQDRELETREQALERLLRVALHSLRENEEGREVSLRWLLIESTFWLEGVPRGARPAATVPKKRQGYELVAGARIERNREAAIAAGG